jgi:sec-independent protein translocase protein TatA
MLFGIFSIGPMEWAILGVVAVLLFGSRLPEVARGLGKSVTEFKKGLRGIQSELDDAMDDRHVSNNYQDHIDDHEEPTAPRFEPPTSEPREVAEAAPAASAPQA